MELINKKNYDAIDLLKFILSIMVVAIHTRFLRFYTFPWLRLAVPLFFIISSYFFFKKIKDKPAEVQNNALCDFTKRNLKLYLFYFVLLSPVTVYLKRKIFLNGFFGVVWTVIRDFLFGSTFRASWFIVANIIGVAIIFLLSKKIGNTGVLLISLIVYALVTLRSSYMMFFENISSVTAFWDFYPRYFGEPFNSFPVSLVWVAIGKCFADGTFGIAGRKKQITLSVIGALLLFGEYYIVHYVLMKNTLSDCYFALLFVCPPLFALFRDMDIHLKSAKTLRKLSTMIYPLHGTVIIIVRFLFKPFNVYHTVWEFFLSLALTFIFILLLLLLEKITKLKVLKYSH